MVLWRPTRSSKTNNNNNKTSILIIYRGLDCKSRKSEDTAVTEKFGLGVQNEAGQRLIEFFQENALVIANTLFQQHREDSTHGHHQIVKPKSDWLHSLQPKMEKLYYKTSKNKTRSWLWLKSWTHYAKFRLKLKKVGKTTRPFRYDLNQIPYDYTVEVRNRFEGLELIDRTPERLWTGVHDIV